MASSTSGSATCSHTRRTSASTQEPQQLDGGFDGVVKNHRRAARAVHALGRGRHGATAGRAPRLQSGGHLGAGWDCRRIDGRPFRIA